MSTLVASTTANDPSLLDSLSSLLICTSTVTAKCNTRIMLHSLTQIPGSSQVTFPRQLLKRARIHYEFAYRASGVNLALRDN